MFVKYSRYYEVLCLVFLQGCEISYVLLQIYFSHFGILWSPSPWGEGGMGTPGPRKPQVGNNIPTFIFDIFKIIGIRNCPYIFFLSFHWFRILLISASFLILSDSDISGLLQGSLAHYMFLNSISQLLKLNP